MLSYNERTVGEWLMAAKRADLNFLDLFNSGGMALTDSAQLRCHADRIANRLGRPLSALTCCEVGAGLIDGLARRAESFTPPSHSADRLAEAGQLLFGDRWQSDLARALGVNDRRVREWVSRSKGPPGGIWIELADLLDQRAKAATALASILRQPPSS